VCGYQLQGSARKHMHVIYQHLSLPLESLAFEAHPGVLAAKVRDFGANLLKCARAQMGIKPAKVGHLASTSAIYSNVLKCAPGGGESQKARSSLHKKVFAPRADQIC